MAAKETTLDVRWRGELAFEARNAQGGQILMGRIGDEAGLGAMETLLASVAGCSGYDVVYILRKKRKPITDVRIQIRGRRRAEHPKVYERVHIVYHVYGDGLQAKDVEQAIRLSLEKYCSASATLAAWAEITFEYHVHPAADAPADAPGRTATS